MRKYLSFLLVAILFLFCYQIDIHAATITLKSGVVINGPLLDMNDDSVTIQDPITNQPRNIKTVYIRDIVLTGAEQKIKDKKMPPAPAPAPAPVKPVKPAEFKPAGTAIAPSDLLFQLDPQLGLMPGIAYPIGDLGKAVNIGFGANLFSDVRVPIPQDVKGFQIRLGLSVGFLYHTTSRSDVSSTMMMLPITAYGRFLYNFDLGFRPYVRVGGGITPVMAGTTDMDPTVAFALGLGYINDKIPYLEFFVEAGMMMVFESVRGDFITANVGVAYRFGAPQPAITGLKK